MNQTRRSPRKNDDLCKQVDVHFKNFNEEIERTLRDHQDFEDYNGSQFSDSRNSSDSVDGCITNIQPSPTRSQNSSPGLLSDYDRVSNCSSSFTSKTSNSSSASDRCDDVKSTSSLCFESQCYNNENQLKNNILSSCCENVTESIYLNDTSKHRNCCDNPHRKFIGTSQNNFCCYQNHKSIENDVNSNKCTKGIDWISSKVEVRTPSRKQGRRQNKGKQIRITEENCDESYEHSPERNSDQESIQERLGYHELKILNNNPIKNHNGVSSVKCETVKNSVHMDSSKHENCCDNSSSDTSVWVLRSDLKVPRTTTIAENTRGRNTKGFKRFDELTNQFNEPLSTSSSSLPLTHANSNMRKSHSNITHRSTCNMFITDLGNKSSSAPILKKVNESQELLSSHIRVTKQPRSQSDKHLAEIQAAEACKWLRAAGFPQYAQMYEDHQFPIDLSSVKKDHSFLEPDSCKSLFRRLDTLNKCANIKVDSWRSNQDDSEDENQCALSQNWTFQPEQRRWSRTKNNEPLQPLQTISGYNTENIHDHSNTNSPSKKSTHSYDINLILNNDDVSLSRSGSEKIKDGAKALLRRVESIKTRRRKKQNRDGMVIYKDGDIFTIQHKTNLSIPTLVLPKDIDSDNSSQYSPKILSPHSPVNSASLSPRRVFHRTMFLERDDTPRRAFVNRRGSVSLDRRDTVEAVSDSEVQRTNSRKSRDVEKLRRDGHLAVSDYDSDMDEHEITRECRNSWHSIQMGISQHTFVEAGGLSLLSLTCGQLQVLRKLALLKLTGLIEKYCPTHKTGWNWELPKFIRKIKTPDYKNKAVFGVPLIVNLQRTGNPLPWAIQKAMGWLRKEAVDQVGLFRKSGVRSRIQALKTEVEKTNDFTLFDDQQAYDVADMIKQYFRELPEALLTTKLSETLILIFQHVPPAFRREAVSYVILLMPNEHCEVLQYILNFFQAITESSSENQMNASNLALCFAPSLFYYNQAATLSTNTRHNSVSPRRKKATGTPDSSDLNENKAAYECLLYLIKHQKSLFIVPKDMLNQCKFTDLDQSKPLPLAELGEHAGWKSYLEDCIHALQKEAKDRARGWMSASGNSSNSEVEIAYKKVGDGHPLRLWRVATEIEAPPQEVLHRVLHERHIWDPTLINVQMVQQLDAQSEIYQYQCASIEPLASRDYCVLRTWRTDLPRGACAIVETSVDHKDANLSSSSIRAVVLASRYLIEPCGSGKSRLMHFSRIDLMGRTPEWYNKCYGHVCRLQLCEIRNSFKHSVSVGPESKV